MASKNLYKMMVQFNKELFIERTQAYSEKQARMIIARRIAKKQEVLPLIVFMWMKEHPEQYEVILECEFEELNNQEGENGVNNDTP